MKSRIVILNYNGEKILRDCLPSILQAAKNATNPTKVTVIDNQSTDQSIQILQKEFPQINVYHAPENRVLCSYNEFLQRIDDDIVILLNNDIRVDANFVDTLVKPFKEHSDLFMVAPRCQSYDGMRYEGGRCRCQIKGGFFWSACVYPGYETKINMPDFTMSSGFGAFDRIKFLSLGGYDDLYLPGRLEDNDICFRAWRSGWILLYEPKSIVYHMGAVAFNDKFGIEKTLSLAHRNSFIFLWKNISDPVYLLEHIALLIPRLIYAWSTGNRSIVEGFFQALPFLGRALKKRKEVLSHNALRSDREIFKKVS